ncbi:PREDICTED: U1 small nuclear ribonucleoprotein 70 kDa isoform X2 [Nelumbo nucifera]|uniref:U1 small nuclear ribonucleoprotein 70 kDa isoform X2 n=1 Tax=Nelumbo nucifera TaxID=4432 RepID=A0A1U7ZQQ8_NELNU|nr:PREDICTED: U1 small nuclear ribonucleoprotein 70 kDa isoform X2 [Nelumbo nucifera]XP_010254266.1 PREDICTED: U1 small nuclear ribonucleoprotein 70 kDa isoform X2 [Nelumbo nucifera]
MTIDDDNSIYVGGLPYDCTEDSLRRVFDLYGSVVAVKIINDREVGGKCYGFVTFTNPRSAIDAINDMNGRTIGGRIVRVNEVKTRGTRPNFNRENFHRDSERDRGLDWDRGRDRDRNYDNEREGYRNRDRSRDRHLEREREHGRRHDHDRTRDHFLDRDRDRDRDQEENEQVHDRNIDRDREKDRDLDWDRDRDRSSSGHDRSRDKDKDQQLKKRTSKELSSNSSDDYYDQAKEQLELSIQRREDLQKEISQLEEKLEGKQQLVSDLQKKSQKLEEALAAAKKLSSYRCMQLTKLYKCFLQVKDYTERLKSSEQELQSLVDMAMLEADEVGIRDGNLYANGKA